MNNYLAFFVGCLLMLPFISCEQSEKGVKMQFSSAESLATYSWALNDMAPDLPSDWSTYNYLVLEMKASSPQRFSMGPLTAGGLLPKNIQPFPGAWIRFTIPLDYFRELPASAVDMAATYNKRRKLGQINIHTSQVGPLTGIDSLVFFMRNPVNDPTLEIRSVSLDVEDPGEALLQEGYLVDAFGQWATKDWTGKVKSSEELQAAWKAEDEQLETPLSSEVSQYGGYKSAPRQKATDFFRVDKIDGRWWFVDPEGYLFLSAGVDCMNASVRTTTEGREFIFDGLKEGEGYADYYLWNIQKRYGVGNEREWINTAVKRMHNWGLNTIANWSSREIIGSNRMPFVLSLPGLKLHEGIMGLPDVYNPQYEKDIDQSIGGMAAQYKDNPWLLGYFVGNEQPWPGQESVLCDRILALEKEAPIKGMLQSYLKANGDTPENRVDFVQETFNVFLGLVNRTLKKHDPNHLNLGMRFGGHTSNALLAITAKHFDVFSFNCYEIQPSLDFMKRIDEQTALPIIIGEYHFGVPDRGMAAGIMQVPNYDERANAYRFYNEQGYSHPSLIGAHWFQWIDQANTGRMDGENYNIGLLDITDRPYPEMVKAMQETHKRIYQVHSGELAPYDISPKATGY
ncbi:hypothetical protein M2459_003176 [Parabacteroides sp. PF5-5]|uniref:hypothetical protein n=1 Tax=unclassified Parabacteroides TaxID=2649774 RepID=UPI002474B90C|nr:MULTISPECIES: hypothetical protein [unclassified Parabacteroides]MDH6306452.1 hypothetical protein [Parabacteroides sp. PH5-39]MDH6317396.1 hypothetical protein [Parabacteroides sp. PF5-13]MDH6321163.1 hypothetical protein [Parabacteroides sp. PH5-13]MDH6324895.1 hypothetical protein [Parabacteroides sp. PH5-8]MDH6328581.1 hypothetical protein [Parabacteroides sp. PH5-41]